MESRMDKDLIKETGSHVKRDCQFFDLHDFNANLYFLIKIQKIISEINYKT